MGSVIDATEGEGLPLRRNVEGEFILTNALLTHADTTLTDGHRHALTPVAEHQGAVAPLTSAPHRQQTPAEHAPRRIVALPADPGTAAESGLAATLSHLLERLRLGSADEWLRWMRTYALLWLAGVVFYLLLAAGAFIADGILTWSP